MIKDKRSYTRYAVFLGKWTCSKISLSCANGPYTMITVDNVSGSGLGVTSHEKLAKGESVELELVFPGDDIPIFVKGRVAWVRKDPDVGNLYHAGVHFTKIHTYDKKRLIKYLHGSATGQA